MPIRKPLRSDRVTGLIAASVNARQTLVILALVETGLSPNELARLEDGDINWKEGTLRIAGRRTGVTISATVLSLLRERFGAGRKMRLGVRQIQRIVRVVAHKA